MTKLHLGNYTQGSSPRMRGALCGYQTASRYQRIIPADAGSTIDKLLHDKATMDHPRGCGEHQHSDPLTV